MISAVLPISQGLPFVCPLYKTPLKYTKLQSFGFELTKLALALKPKQSTLIKTCASEDLLCSLPAPCALTCSTDFSRYAVKTLPGPVSNKLYFNSLVVFYWTRLPIQHSRALLDKWEFNKVTTTWICIVIFRNTCRSYYGTTYCTWNSPIRLW